jgi:hypothetical protein
MKKNILIALLLLVSAGASAQIAKDTTRISWNVKAGLNFNRISQNGTSTKTGFYMGTGIEFHSNNTWSLQAALLFTSKGAKIGDTMPVTANYLELPIMVIERLKLKEKVNFVVSFGPYFAIGVGGSINMESYGEKVSIGTFDPIASGRESFQFMNRFDAGLGAGLGIEFGSLAIIFDAKIGLLDVGGRINIENMRGDLNFKNKNLSLGISYNFR